MLRAGVLHVSEGAEELAARGTYAEVPVAWRELEGRLRAFVARRVPTAADVDDVIQEVFLRLARGVGSLREEERLAPWVFTIARNVVNDQHRRGAREVAADELAAGIAAEEDAAESPLERELVACVARFVAELPAEQREAITLVELEGMSQKDAAELLGLSHSGMKSRVQRGRAELRRKLESACAIELDARRKVMECEPRACGTCGSPGAARGDHRDA